MKEMVLPVAGYLTEGHSIPLVAYTYKFPHAPLPPPLSLTHTHVPVGRALNEVTLCCCKDGCVRREGGGRGEGGKGRKGGEGRGRRERGRRKLRADGKCVFVSNVNNLSIYNTSHATLI